jgi:hypothetical protein
MFGPKRDEAIGDLNTLNEEYSSGIYDIATDNQSLQCAIVNGK